METFLKCFGKSSGKGRGDAYFREDADAVKLGGGSANSQANNTPFVKGVTHTPNGPAPAALPCLPPPADAASNSRRSLLATGDGDAEGDNGRLAQARDRMICVSMPAAITVFNKLGQIVHQNPASIRYYGARVHHNTSRTAVGEDVLAQVFALEPEKLEAMRLELTRDCHGRWRGILRMPPSLHPPCSENLGQTSGPRPSKPGPQLLLSQTLPSAQLRPPELPADTIVIDTCESAPHRPSRQHGTTSGFDSCATGDPPEGQPGPARSGSHQALGQFRAWALRGGFRGFLAGPVHCSVQGAEGSEPARSAPVLQRSGTGWVGFRNVAGSGGGNPQLSGGGASGNAASEDRARDLSGTGTSCTQRLSMSPAQEAAASSSSLYRHQHQQLPHPHPPPPPPPATLQNAAAGPDLYEVRVESVRVPVDSVPAVWDSCADALATSTFGVAFSRPLEGSAAPSHPELGMSPSRVGMLEGAASGAGSQAEHPPATARSHVLSDGLGPSQLLYGSHGHGPAVAGASDSGHSSFPANVPSPDPSSAFNVLRLLPQSTASTAVGGTSTGSHKVQARAVSARFTHRTSAAIFGNPRASQLAAARAVVLPSSMIVPSSTATASQAGGGAASLNPHGHSLPPPSSAGGGGGGGGSSLSHSRVLAFAGSLRNAPSAAQVLAESNRRGSFQSSHGYTSRDFSDADLAAAVAAGVSGIPPRSVLSGGRRAMTQRCLAVTVAAGAGAPLRGGAFMKSRPSVDVIQTNPPLVPHHPPPKVRVTMAHTTTMLGGVNNPDVEGSNASAGCGGGGDGGANGGDGGGGGGRSSGVQPKLSGSVQDSSVRGLGVREAAAAAAAAALAAAVAAGHAVGDASAGPTTATPHGDGVTGSGGGGGGDRSAPVAAPPTLKLPGQPTSAGSWTIAPLSAAEEQPTPGHLGLQSSAPTHLRGLAAAAKAAAAAATAAATAKAAAAAAGLPEAPCTPAFGPEGEPRLSSPRSGTQAAQAMSTAAPTACSGNVAMAPGGEIVIADAVGLPSPWNGSAALAAVTATPTDREVVEQSAVLLAASGVSVVGCQGPPAAEENSNAGPEAQQRRLLHSGKQFTGSGMVAASCESRTECWHEVWATRAVDPVTGQDVVVLAQHDVTAKVVAERHLALVMEAEHRLLEQLFPKHILTHVTEEWVRQEAAATSVAASGMLSPEPSTRENGGCDGGGTSSGVGVSRGGGGQGPASSSRGGRSGAGGGSCSKVVPELIKGGLSPALLDPDVLSTWHPNVTLLFADIKGFTPMCEQVPPRAVMKMLNQLFSRFDAMLDKFGVFKVETIGDCYFVAGGLITEDEDGMAAVRDCGCRGDPLHAQKVFMFAKAMLAASREVILPTTGQPVEMRIGIHSGPVVSGVVGTRMPRFCLFGDTVNTTSRMESTGVPGAIHASSAAHALLKSEAWQPTGGIEVKGKGFMQTYLWRPLLADEDGGMERQLPTCAATAAAAAAARLRAASGLASEAPLREGPRVTSLAPPRSKSSGFSAVRLLPELTGSSGGEQDSNEGCPSRQVDAARGGDAGSGEGTGKATVVRGSIVASRLTEAVRAGVEGRESYVSIQLAKEGEQQDVAADDGREADAGEGARNWNSCSEFGSDESLELTTILIDTISRR